MESVDAILDLQVPDSVSISPDGKRVAYITTNYMKLKTGEHETSSIWVAEAAEEKSARQLTSGFFQDQKPRWSPDGKSIFFISDRKEAGKKPGLYRLDLSGGEPILLTSADYERKIDKFEISPDGQFIAIIRPEEKTAERKKKDEEKDDPNVFGEDWEFNVLHLLHIQSKTTEVLVKGDFNVTDATWNPDSSSIAYTTTATTELESASVFGSELRLVKISNKQSSLISKFKYSARNDGQKSGIVWAGDRIWSVCSAFADKEETSNIIFSIPVDGGEWRAEVGDDKTCGAALAAWGSTILAYTEDGLYSELRSPDKAKQPLFRHMCTIDAFDVRITSEGHSVVALTTSTVNSASEVYTFISTKGDDSAGITEISRLTRLSDHGHSVKAKNKIVTLPISCQSSDGKADIQGLFLAPESSCSSDGKVKTPLKTFVEPHGGPYYRYTAKFRHGYGWARTLLEAGYGVFLPNYRGSSGGGTTLAGPFVAGTVDYDDVITLTDQVVKDGLADPKHLIIGGWSQGGFLTYLALVRNGTHGLGWKFKAGIAGAGVCDWDSMTFGSDMPSFEAICAGGEPWSMKKGDIKTRTGSAVWEFDEAVKDARVPPVLILHGEKDERVPVAQAWAFHRACRRRGVECQMVTYPREPHSFSERKHVLDLFQRVLKFCHLHFG